MAPYVPSLQSIMETLRLAEQGYLVDDAPHRPAVRPMPWRRILHCLIAMERGDELQVEPGTSDTGRDDLMIRRIAANRWPATARAASPARAAASHGSTMHAAISVNARLLNLSRFAQDIERTVWRGQCRVTCVKTNSEIRALVTGPAAASPAQFSFADRLRAPRGQSTSAPASDPTHSLQTGGMSK